MKKTFKAYSGSVLMLTATLLCFSSCVNEEYDVDNLNSEITIGSESLTLPIGSTKQLTLENLFSGMDQDMLQVLDDGSYALRMGDKMNFGDMMPDFSDMLHIDDIDVSSSVSIPFRTQGQFQIHLKRFQVEFEDETSFTLIDSSFPSKEIKSIDDIILEDTDIRFDLRFDNLPDFGEEKDIKVELVLTMPDEMLLDQDDQRIKDHVVTVKGVLDDGVFPMEPLKIVGFNLSEYDLEGGEDLVERIKVKGCITVDDTDVDFGQMHDNSRFSMAVSLKNVVVKEVHSHVYFEVDADEQHVSLGGFPDFMKDDDFMLDIVNPHLILKLGTNMRIPASEVLRITPVVDGKKVTDNAIDIRMSLPVAESSDKPAYVNFWLGDDKSLCPEGYTYVKAEMRKLISKIPDEFLFNIHSETDALEDCVIEPGADTFLDLEYDVVIPMEFGQDLHVELSETMSDLPDILREILAKNSVQLSGEVTSTLPVQLDLTVDLLDKNGKVIVLTEKATQKIVSCKPDGSANVSPLNLTLDVKDGASAASVDALKLTFVMSSPDASGIPLMKDDYVQAKLRLTLPEGITVDLENI